MVLAKIPINELREPAHVARAAIDERGLDELAEDIKRVGVLVPLHVEEVDGGYEVVAGHRRLLAARRAGLAALPCLVRQKKDATSTVIKLHENLYREELSPIEEAAFYAELYKQCGNDTDALCLLVKQSRQYVEGRLNLLRGHAVVLQALAAKEIPLGVAQELNKFHEDDVDYYLGWVRRTGASAALVRQWRAQAEANRAAGVGRPAEPTTETAAKPAAGYSGPICFACGAAEPLHDVEFWYLHRGCKATIQRFQEAAGVNGSLVTLLHVLMSQLAAKAQREPEGK
jgi:ParB/RepB/Spo0J family partition protein